MKHTLPSARTATSRIQRRLLVGLIAVLAVMAAIAVSLGHRAQNSPSSSFFSFFSFLPFFSSSPAASSSKGSAALGEAGGAVPEGTTVLDDDVPAVANLDPELLEALRRASKDAEGDGLRLYVNSGWRSPEYQKRLLREAVAKYGSEAEAARWVATAKTSPHVSGEAVDIGRPNAATWLSEHGHEYALCQIYRNEPWHYELRSDAIELGCPQMYADPTKDPRMHK